MKKENAIKNLLNKVVRRRNIQERRPIKYSMPFALQVFERIGGTFEPDYKIDDENQNAIKECIKYIFNDQNFKGDLKKGLLLYGNVGSGKSLVFMVLQEMIRLDNRVKKDHFFKFDSSPAVADSYEAFGQAGIKKYLDQRRCFDDLGQEELIKAHYKSQINVLQHILTQRYISWQRSGLLTHGTTNYTEENFGELYGRRVQSRAKEMFNFVRLVSNEDRRQAGFNKIK